MASQFRKQMKDTENHGLDQTHTIPPTVAPMFVFKLELGLGVGDAEVGTVLDAVDVVLLRLVSLALDVMDSVSASTFGI